MGEEFSSITTQEQLNGIINDRLKRERESTAKKYEGWISPDDQAKNLADLQKQLADITKSSEALAKKYAGYDKDLAEKESMIKGYETASEKTQIALALGLPYEMASRLKGETKEDIQKDAESLKSLMAPKNAAPASSTEPEGVDKKTAAYKQLLEKIQ